MLKWLKHLFVAYDGKQLRIGMTKDEVMDLWGWPKSYKENSQRYLEQWHYGGWCCGYLLYFTKDKLDNWTYES